MGKPTRASVSAISLDGWLLSGENKDLAKRPKPEREEKTRRKKELNSDLPLYLLALDPQTRIPG